jgi:hypothetical protein
MPEDIGSLQHKVSQLNKRVLLLTWLWVGTISIVAFMNAPRRVNAATVQNLKVRRLEVVDEKGVARVVISAPLPEPVINGKRGKRDTPMSGILIYDPKGNERGGYGTSDAADLSALLTLDSENSQVFTAYANGASSGATVWVANEDNQNVIMSTHNTALFEITRGKTIIYKQPPDAPDLKQ